MYIHIQNITQDVFFEPHENCVSRFTISPYLIKILLIKRQISIIFNYPIVVRVFYGCVKKCL